MALPMYDQPQYEPPTKPTLALVPSCESAPVQPPVRHRLPAPVYWFRRVLAAAVLLGLFWVSSMLAVKLGWILVPVDPTVGLSQSEPTYVIVDDTALRVVSDAG